MLKPNSTSESSFTREEETKLKVTRSKGVSIELMLEIKQELENMLLFAMRNGKIINTQVNPLIESNNLDKLIQAHNILVENIKPATPKSVKYLKTLYNKKRGTKLISTLPVIRNLIFLALVFLILFIGTSVSDKVDIKSLSKGILDNQGESLFYNLLFLCSMSGIGVVFYLLKKISLSIKNGALVPEQSIYYVAIIILGIIAGLMLSEIIYFDSSDRSSIFNKCILALVGGFSSDAIFSILKGIVDKIKTILTVKKF
ncbi:hypothetical protein U8527_07305 [Kordia algicida OT-1]|uniref:Uncharacterized protein n=1 Tax=Kordia algicida OT-1 TaxID=391587 RepID=A9EA74_9FLAO|nr:hypothetical protein [Kordia algicida]EDP94752.1 hypothetical protein KAOT1_00710 [Kordia algicida OT-1]